MPIYTTPPFSPSALPHSRAQASSLKRLAEGMYPESGPTWQRGAEATRTPGLLHAMQALYQLSYSPAALTIAPPLRRLHAVGPSFGRTLASTRATGGGR